MAYPKLKLVWRRIKKIGYSETVLVELVINDKLAAEGLKLRVKAEVA